MATAELKKIVKIVKIAKMMAVLKTESQYYPGTEAAVRYDGRANGVVDEGHEGDGNVHDDGVEVHDGVGDEDEDDDDDQMVHQQRGYEPCLFSCSQMLLLPDH